MTTPAEDERKVRQLGNDVNAICGLLENVKSVQQQHSSQLSRLRATQMQQGGRLDQIEDRLYGMEQQLTGVETRLDEHGGKLDQILGLLRPGRAGTP